MSGSRQALVAVLLCAGCVRAGFSPAAVDGVARDHRLGEVSADAAGSSPTYHIAPTGSDSNPGSEALPWRTWNFAISKLTPGATLVALDGVYPNTAQTPLAIDCTPASTTCAGGPCPSGAPDRPIRLRAANERLARIPSGERSGLVLRGCTDWQIEGLRFDQSDGDGKGELSVVRAEGVDRVVLRRLLVIHPDRSKNSHGVLVSHSRDVLLVEAEVYEFHRYGILATGGARITLRRNYLNSRALPDLPGGYASEVTTTGDAGIVLAGVLDATAENNIVEEVHTGVEVSAAAFPDRVPGGGDRNRLLGNVVRKATVGYFARSSCSKQPVCDPSTLTVSELSIRDCVAVATSKGFALGGVENASLENLTSSSASEVDYHLYRMPENSGMKSSVKLSNSLNFGVGGTGVWVEQQTEWSVDHCNSHGNDANYLPAAGPTASTSLDPKMGGCLVYLPPGSPMLGAGAKGGDIGANVRFALENGALTSTRLWTPSSGIFFGCGAAVSGNGLGQGNVCRDVHQRLNVGADGCALP